jgi:hypothetical protein
VFTHALLSTDQQQQKLQKLGLESTPEEFVESLPVSVQR